MDVGKNEFVNLPMDKTYYTTPLVYYRCVNNMGEFYGQDRSFTLGYWWDDGCVCVEFSFINQNCIHDMIYIPHHSGSFRGPIIEDCVTIYKIFTQKRELDSYDNSTDHISLTPYTKATFVSSKTNNTAELNWKYIRFLDDPKCFTTPWLINNNNNELHSTIVQLST